VTAFIVLNNRSGQYGFAGTTIVDVNRWCSANFGRDALHFAQTLTARFDAAFIVLRVISSDRLFVRARIFQGPTPVATMAFRLAPRLRQAHLSWIVLAPTVRGGLVSKPLLQNLLLIERDCGITRVTLRAGLSHGGYVWAIHGFLPETDAKWLQLAARLQAKLATRRRSRYRRRKPSARSCRRRIASPFAPSRLPSRRSPRQLSASISCWVKVGTENWTFLTSLQRLYT